MVKSDCSDDMIRDLSFLSTFLTPFSDRYFDLAEEDHWQLQAYMGFTAVDSKGYEIGTFFLGPSNLFCLMERFLLDLHEVWV